MTRGVEAAVLRFSRELGPGPHVPLELQLRGEVEVPQLLVLETLLESQNDLAVLPRPASLAQTTETLAPLLLTTANSSWLTSLILN